MKNPHASKKNISWMGTSVPLETILPYMDKFTAPARENKYIHYIYSARDRIERASEVLCTMRFCWMDLADEQLTIVGDFDGINGERTLCDKDLIIGGYNGFNQIKDMNKANYDGFSLIFHLHHIRMQYGEVRNGKHKLNFYYHTPRPASGTLKLMLEAMDRIIHDVEHPRQERAKSLLQAIIQQLRHDLTLTEGNMPRIKKSKQAMRIKSYLEHNFNCDIDCSHACDALEINRSYGSTLFKEEFGITMKEYLNTLRLDAAAALLENENNIKIEAVADLCGFSSVSYFIKVFRKHYNISPGNYRSRAIRRDNETTSSE